MTETLEYDLQFKPYDFHESLPNHLALEPGEFPVSSVRIPRYLCVKLDFPLKNLYFYFPSKFSRLLRTITAELQDREIHGTGTAFNKGCRGPLCRRYKRYLDAERSTRIAERDRLRRDRDAQAIGRVIRDRPKRVQGTFFERLLVARPQYAAADPIIVLFCIASYSQFGFVGPDVLPKSINKKWLELAQKPEKILDFLKKEYPNVVI